MKNLPFVLNFFQQINFAGGNREIIRRNLPNPMGLALSGDHVYWIDRNINTIFKASKHPGNISPPERFKTNLDSLRDIAIFDANNQPTKVENQCTRLGNGGCEQLCFSFPPKTDTRLKSCACATGVLGKDLRTCSDPDQYLIFLTRTEIRSLSLDPKKSSVPFEPVEGLVNAVGLDFDFTDNKLIYTQVRPFSKMGMLPSSSPTKDDITPVALPRATIPEGVAYDWVANKIYFADTNNGSIHSINPDGTHLVMIVQVDRPRAIALDPCRG